MRDEHPNYTLSDSSSANMSLFAQEQVRATCDQFPKQLNIQGENLGVTKYSMLSCGAIGRDPGSDSQPPTGN